MFYKITIEANLVIGAIEIVSEKLGDTEKIKYLDIDIYKDKVKSRKGVLRFINNEIIDDENYVEINLLDEKNRKINLLRKNLLNTDYQIIKCYEAFMRQLPLPYNLEELSTQRDAWRAEINQLEEELKTL
jgi:hypothetical protein